MSVNLCVCACMRVFLDTSHKKWLCLHQVCVMCRYVVQCYGMSINPCAAHSPTTPPHTTVTCATITISSGSKRSQAEQASRPSSRLEPYVGLSLYVCRPCTIYRTEAWFGD